MIQIMGERFQKQNILVVPLTLTRFPAGDAAKGFGRTKAEEKPYVAQAPEGLRGDWCVGASILQRVDQQSQDHVALCAVAPY